MNLFAVSFALAVAGNVLYHVSQKSIPAAAPPLLTFGAGRPLRDRRREGSKREQESGGSIGRARPSAAQLAGLGLCLTGLFLVSRR